MTNYIDGFVLPVPANKLSEYKKMSVAMGKLMKKYGALEYIESVGDDLNPDMSGMEVTRFPEMAKAKQGEAVLFSYIVFKSRAHRDKVNKKVMEEMMKDPKMKKVKMPFDMKRMAYGGFKAIVEI